MVFFMEPSVPKVSVTEREKEWATKASRFIKAELKRAGLGYRELAERLNAHGLQETEDSITGKLTRGTFPVTFWLACLSVLGLHETKLNDL
jgi:hypothetical protein